MITFSWKKIIKEMAPGIVNIQLDQSIIKLFIFSIPLIKLKISTLCGVMYGYEMNYIFFKKKTIHKVKERIHDMIPQHLSR